MGTDWKSFPVPPLSLSPTLGFRCFSREAGGPRFPAKCPLPGCEQRLPHPELDAAQ